MRKITTAAILLCSILGWCVCGRAERSDQVLAGGWRFIKQDAGLNAETVSWEQVSLPHSWNAFDGQDGQVEDRTAPGDSAKGSGKAGQYFRGPCWYARSLDLPVLGKGRRVFLYFEAASSVAKVWLNGQLVGEHRGAFTAFCFEVTRLVNWSGSNELRVRVDNSARDDLPPLSGDFNLAGGLYRPVHLLITDEVCVTPLESASPGVYLTVRSIDSHEATVLLRALVSNGGEKATPVTVETTVYRPTGKKVEVARTEINLPVGTTTPVEQVLTIPRPHRWQGREDPFVYRVAVRVKRRNDTVDTIEQPLGLRTIAVTEDRGFLLNDKPYPLRGVNRHQDWRDKAWALTDADHERDFQLITEMGATAVRLAHYPQAKKVYDVTDQLGLLVWHELSLVDLVRDTPDFRENAATQLRELLLQNYNHPSIAFVGLFNEIRRGTGDQAYPVIKYLHELLKTIDPTRISVSASNVLAEKINQVPDRLGFNVYPGWYSGAPDDMTKLIDQRYADAGGRRIALSEYGAGANPEQHEENTPKMPVSRGPWHPEEWQSYVHERDWAQCKDNPKLWGTFLWVMFDFASDARNEGGRPGINDKGMVTQDRKVKKDAFYFYQANWTKDPMVHITSARATPRHDVTTEVKVYSNCVSVELFVNGRGRGLVHPDALRIARWPEVVLQPGENHLEVIGRAGDRVVQDRCSWTVDTAPSR